MFSDAQKSCMTIQKLISNNMDKNVKANFFQMNTIHILVHIKGIKIINYYSYALNVENKPYFMHYPIHI